MIIGFTNFIVMNRLRKQNWNVRFFGLKCALVLLFCNNNNDNNSNIDDDEVLLKTRKGTVILYVWITMYQSASTATSNLSSINNQYLENNVGFLVNHNI